jgi:hypothetical protein
MNEDKSSKTITDYPRIKKGSLIVAVKDNYDGKKPDYLATNSYFATFLRNKPPYWEKLLDLLYREGRLKKYASPVEDIVDKFSFLFLAKDQISFHESQLNWRKRFFVKYFAYTFVFMTKSFLDALAVFINEIYQLGFNGGEIDFKKGRFINEIKNKNNELGSLLSKKQQFITKVVKYRDNLIHKHGLYVGAIPTVPEDIKDPKEVDLFILKEPHYIPNDPNLLFDDVYGGKEGEFIRLSCFVDDWISESTQLFHIVLSNFTKFFYISRKMR